MVYSSFDPRIAIREQIGYTKNIKEFGDIDRSTVSVTFPSSEREGDICYLPMYLPGECRTEDLPPMPFIEMTLVSAPSEAHNVGGNVRYNKAYIDFNIYYTNTDDVVATEFGKTVADEIVDKITQYRSSVTDSYFCEVINDGREIIEAGKSGKQVVFHRVLEVLVNDYNNG